MKKDKSIDVKTRYGMFQCFFESNYPEEGYTVTVPKLRGVVTHGKDIKEAQKMVKEAIELHCECLLDENLAEVKVKRHSKKLVHA